MPVENIIKELSTLSTIELQTIKAHVEFLTKNKPNTVTAKRSPLKGYIHICAKRYVPVMDLSIIERTNPLHMDDKLEEVAVAIEKLGSELKLDRKELLRLCQVITEASTLKVKEVGIPLSLNTMLWALCDPTNLINEAFPGYIKSPLFKSIVLQ